MSHHQNPNPLLPVETKTKTKQKEEEKEVNGLERLKRHRKEIAGKVWIPETWGQDEYLKEWTDCSVFDDSLVPNGVVSARAALVREATRQRLLVISNSNRLT